MNSKTDFLGNVLNIDDEIVFMKLNYRSLARGIVKRITEKTVLIDDGSSDGVRQFHDQVIKI